MAGRFVAHGQVCSHKIADKLPRSEGSVFSFAELSSVCEGPPCPGSDRQHDGLFIHQSPRGYSFLPTSRAGGTCCCFHKTRPISHGFQNWWNFWWLPCGRLHYRGTCCVWALYGTSGQGYGTCMPGRSMRGAGIECDVKGLRYDCRSKSPVDQMPVRFEMESLHILVKGKK